MPSARAPRDVRHVVRLAPHDDAAEAPLPGMSVVPAEPGAVTLFTLADLLVSQGADHRTSASHLTKTGAPFLLRTRRCDDRRECVDALAALGPRVVPGRAPKALAAHFAGLAVAPETRRGRRDRSPAARVDARDRRVVAGIVALADRAQGRCMGQIAGAAA